MADVNTNYLTVEVLTPVRTLFEGLALSVSSLNKHGPFDILPGHARFISLIKNRLVIYTEERQQKKFELDRGVLQCEDNQIKVYVGV